MPAKSCCVTAAVLFLAAAQPVARAQPVAPQPNTPCEAGLAGALTQLPDLTTFLQCKDGQWRVFADPYPHSGRWLTYGPDLTLHGEAQRNREIDSGDWIGVPQEPDSQCTAEQVAIADTGSLGPTEASTGSPGETLRLNLRPLLFTVELGGRCLWERE